MSIYRFMVGLFYWFYVQKMHAGKLFVSKFGENVLWDIILTVNVMYSMVDHRGNTWLMLTFILVPCNDGSDSYLGPHEGRY